VGIAHQDNVGKEEKMKKENHCRWIQVVLIPMALLVCASLSLAQYAIDFDVISGGGGESKSDNYILFDTLGQSSPIGASKTPTDPPTHFLYAGFWSAFLPDIATAPGSHDFQRVFIGQSSSPTTFTVRNPGTGNLAIEDLSIVGSSDFRLVPLDDHCSNQVLIPPETCSFAVVFSPASLGQKTAKVSIPSNDADDPDGKMEVSLSGRGVLLMVNPEEGTIGTPITIGGSGFGAKKGKVLIGTVKPKISAWGGSVISALFGKAIAPASYNVVVQPKEPKGAEWTTEPGGFTVKLPEIGTVTPPGAPPLGEVTIAGKFFGTKKGKVYLEQAGVRKACKVVSWTMDTIEFLVPKNYPLWTYTLEVTNKVGTGTGSFTVTE
jgi:hypothetical protein